MPDPLLRRVAITCPRDIPPLAVGAAAAARLVGVSLPTLARLDVPCVRIGSRRLYRVAAIDAWLRDHETGGQS